MTEAMGYFYMSLYYIFWTQFTEASSRILLLLNTPMLKMKILSKTWKKPFTPTFIQGWIFLYSLSF